MSQETLHLQYGINLHADHVYDQYQPKKITAAYPDPEANELREALADYVGVTKDMIMCGNGSDELIDVYIRTYAQENKDFTVAVAPPMYYQYPVYAERAGARSINLPHDRSKITPELVKEYGGDPKNTAIMLDTPSNPAGDMVSRKQIIALLDAGYRLFIDEAYYEYCGQTVVDLIPKYPRQLAVSRTLSKFCAMSGSRVGYIIADPAIIAKLHVLKMLFNVNSDGQARALFALLHMDQFHEAVESLRAAKTFTHDAIKKLTTSYFPHLIYLSFLSTKLSQAPHCRVVCVISLLLKPTFLIISKAIASYVLLLEKHPPCSGLPMRWPKLRDIL